MKPGQDDTQRTGEPDRLLLQTRRLAGRAASSRTGRAAETLPILVAQAPRSLARRASHGVCSSGFMTLPGVAQPVLRAGLRALAGWGGDHDGLDAGEGYCRFRAEACLGEQPGVLRFGAPAAREDGDQADVQVLGEVRRVVVGN